MGTVAEAALGLVVLAFISVLVRVLGMRLVPLLLPSSHLQTLILGFLGGLGGHLLGNALWPQTLRLAGIHLPLALVGAALLVLVGGLFPFLRILFGRT